MYLSSWELNQKKPHPKHLENIIDYLSYLPKKVSKKELLGTQTKYFRIKHLIDLENLCQMVNIKTSLVKRIETKRFCKLSKQEDKMVRRALKAMQDFSKPDELVKNHDK